MFRRAREANGIWSLDNARNVADLNSHLIETELCPVLGSFNGCVSLHDFEAPTETQKHHSDIVDSDYIGNI